MKNLIKLFCFLALTIILSSCRKEVPEPPSVTTSAVSGISYTTAIAGGEVINEGGASVISKGVCWGISASPTISSGKTNDGTGSGSFLSNITGLLPNTTYFVRAYATSSIGTSYGNEISFSTQAAELAVKPAKGKAGDEITIKGHFPNDCNVVLANLTITLTSKTLDSVKFKIPESLSAGIKELKVSENNQVIYTSQITIYPGITSINENTVTHGQEIIITGTGFNPTISNDTIKLDDQVVPLNSATQTQIKFIIPGETRIGTKKLSLSVSSLYADTLIDMKVFGWQKATDHPRGPFYEIASFAIEDNIYFCDAIGSGNVEFIDEVWKYNLTNDTWARMADCPGTVNRYSVTCFAINGKGYLGLGDPGSLGNPYGFWEYDPATNQWTQLQDFPGIRRIGQRSFVLNGKGYVGTGYNNGSYFCDFYCFDPTANSWKRVADYPAGPVYAGTTFVLDNKGYLLGGYNGTSMFREMWQYDDLTDSWTKKSDFPGNEAINMLSFGVNSTAYCGLGVLPGNEYATGTLWSYNSEVDTWQIIKPFRGEPRKSYLNGSTGKYGYYGFGSIDSRYYKQYSDLWIYAPIDFLP